MRVTGPRITIEVPSGWEAEIYQPVRQHRVPGGGLVPDAVRPNDPIVLHAANFPLPPGRADFGHDVIPTLGVMQVFVALVEYGPGDASKPLFAAEGMPDIHPDDVSPDTVMGPLVGQAALQRFFHIGERAFCLYAAVGSERMRARLVPAIKEVLDRITIEG
jgi:hypothetical protein